MTEAYGQDAQIPYIFRCGELTAPQDDEEFFYSDAKARRSSPYDMSGVKTDDQTTAAGGGPHAYSSAALQDTTGQHLASNGTLSSDENIKQQAKRPQTLIDLNIPIS